MPLLLYSINYYLVTLSACKDYFIIPSFISIITEMEVPYVQTGREGVDKQILNYTHHIHSCFTLQSNFQNYYSLTYTSITSEDPYKIKATE